ncbi:MAG: polymer-forming cytoskeletal protein [Odoribacter sp.]|nr:polymer-forming cytoskeletal protein [Odoribacter sp.]
MDQDYFDIDYSGSQILTDASVQGNIESEKDICLNGFVEGKIVCAGMVIVNKGGEVKGEVRCRELYLNGVIAGNVCVEEKTVLGAEAVVEGSLTTGCLEITPGAKIGVGLKLKNASK